MLQLKCPNCGADITLDDTRDFGFCSYCGTKVLLDEYKKQVDGIPGIANLLLRAESFLMHDDFEKAKEYYNRVLDIDIHNTGAILGLEMIKNKEYEILAEKKRQAAEKQALIDKYNNDKNYHCAVEIVKAIDREYKKSNKYCEGIVVEGLSDNESYIIYEIRSCSKEDAPKHVPTNGWNGLLQDVNIQKTNIELKQLLNKMGLKSDILFLSYEDKQPIKTRILGNTKWVKAGTISYDVWIKVWK